MGAPKSKLNVEGSEAYLKRRTKKQKKKKGFRHFLGIDDSEESRKVGKMKGDVMVERARRYRDNNRKGAF